MKFRKSIRIAGAITLSGIIGIAGHVSARENIANTHPRKAFRTTSSGYATCVPANAAIDMDINNVNARLMTGGDMWWNIGLGVAAYEIPIGSGKSSQFAASCWIGGYDQQGQLKVCGQTYRQSGNDYWPGALDASAKITGDTCTLWDNFWKVQKSVINSFITSYKTTGTAVGSQYDVIYQWPGAGNTSRHDPAHPGAIGSDGVSKLTQVYSGNTYAGFADLNGNGVYDPDKGEYPVLESHGVESIPDELIWWVFNDAGNVKQMSLTAAIGVEVQTTGFAYATQDFLNNSTFYNYRVINRGALTIDSTYITLWDDCDLGWYYDDFIGCDTTRGLGIQYNGTNDDGAGGGHPVNSYGPYPPQIGVDFFQGPLRPIHRPGLPDTVQQLQMTNFTYFNNDNSVIGNPFNGIQMYYYMTGSITTGQRFSDDFQGPGIPSKGYGSGPIVNFVFWGDPGDRTQWSECACNNNPGDRRFLFSSGPFQLLPGAINDITFGVVWAPQPVGGCPVTNFNEIKSIDDQAQALFDNNFKAVTPPEAPRMVVRALDRQLVFYLTNDYGSNNFGENYGNSSGPYNSPDSSIYRQPVIKAHGLPDSLYVFQGYEVFQLANDQVAFSDIFNQTTGEVDPTKAALVFQCGRANGVTQIVNYVQNISISDTTYIPQIKINGTDSGIVHSFELQYDAFATGADKQFVNYQNYYFVAIAYAYNNFAPFSPSNIQNTQDAPYISSNSGGDGGPVPIITAMPNPVSAGVGAILNSGYGSGITVTRIEGVGNGGNVVELDSASEASAVYTGTVAKDGIAGKASYLTDQGPLSIKVVDPTLVPAYNWVLQINGAATDSGVANTGSWSLTALDASNNVKDVIYSEESLVVPNEQIIEKYGLSVNITQVSLPGANQNNGDGYITSAIVFDDPSYPWLFGVQDMSDSNSQNWLRSGNYQGWVGPVTTADPCNFNDYSGLDVNGDYGNMLANFSPAKSSWGPYVLGAAFTGPNMHAGTGTQCGFDVAYTRTTQNLGNMEALPDVDLVFTSDHSRWTRCAVIEEQEDPLLAQGGAPKFYLRSHASWNLIANGNTPTYSDVPNDTGMSWFPGYAIDEETGNRLDIVFGEDSYLASDNGNDMIWNPSSNLFGTYDGAILFGGKHVVYILKTQYDSDKAFVALASAASPSNNNLQSAYVPMAWVGIPLLNPLCSFNSLESGLIPNTARLTFRVTRPYAAYQAVTPNPSSPVPVDTATPTNPYYTFSTTQLAPTLLSDTSNRSRLLSQIYAVPNPYYGYSGYETSRLDTRVRIINLPAQVVIHIYSLDGTLIQTLSKNDPTVSYLDWTLTNTAGLPVASGMYLMDVQAVGIGETVLRWFGAMRPIDITTY